MSDEPPERQLPTPQTDALIERCARSLAVFIDGTRRDPATQAQFDKFADYIEAITELARGFERDLAAEKARILAPANTDWGRGMLRERDDLKAKIELLWAHHYKTIVK